jgi:enamine deaminase RidA (YjgF/YER057c/UK114 family)
MSGAEARLVELGIELPGRLPAAGSYLPAKRDGSVVYVSGHAALRVDAHGMIAGATTREISTEAAAGAIIIGRVGEELNLEEAREAARLTGLFLLSALREEIGSLDRVRSILKVFGMVNVAPGFVDTPAVIDGCSDLLVDVFGESIGRHARSAVGMAALPFNIPVEIEMVVAIDASGLA